MTSKKWLVSFISGFQWLVLSAFALALAIAIMLVGVLVGSCGQRGDPL